MTVTLIKQSAVEVDVFNLSGKALLTVRKLLSAGSHLVSLPYRGSGVYLYKVIMGNSEFMLKGNSFSEVSYGNSITSQSVSSIHLTKQAKTTAAIEDVIAATKTGYLDYRVVAYNSDTAGITIKMITSAGTVTDVDGNEYQSVKIGNQVWMAENLRVTKYSDSSVIIFDTSTVTWNNDGADIPKYCYYNNTTNADSIKKYGALYNWYIVSPENPKKIAPAGWHVPTLAEWDTLQYHLIANGYNWDNTKIDNKIAKSLAAKTDWLTHSTIGTIGCNLTINNSTGFSALPGGCRDYGGGFGNYGSDGNWWSATESSSAYASSRNLVNEVDCLYRSIAYFKWWGFSIRLVRDN
jgi:uncharacterized protein (TIGR02145 family)